MSATRDIDLQVLVEAAVADAAPLTDEQITELRRVFRPYRQTASAAAEPRHVPIRRAA